MARARRRVDPQDAASSHPGEAAALPAVREEPPLRRGLLHVSTGELLEATPENAAVALASLRDLRRRIADAVKDAEQVLIEESRRVGAKTLRYGNVEAVVSGGSEVVWDIGRLFEGLRAAGCPDERLEVLVTATVEYKVNQAVAKQLAAANPDYAAAIEAARDRQPAPTRVTVKEGRT